MTNTATTCPHYLPAGAVPGVPARCRGCGALIAQPNLVSPEIISTYPAHKGAVEGVEFPPSTSGRNFPADGSGMLFGANTSVQGVLGHGNPLGAVLSEV